MKLHESFTINTVEENQMSPYETKFMTEDERKFCCMAVHGVSKRLSLITVTAEEVREPMTP